MICSGGEAGYMGNLSHPRHHQNRLPSSSELLAAHSHSGFILLLSQHLLGICCVSGTWRLELQRKIILLTSGQRFYFVISLVIYESKHAHSSPGLSGEKWVSSGLSWSQSPLQGAGIAQAVATSKVGSLGIVWC